MNTANKNRERPIPFIRELCTGSSEDELLEAEDNFRRYLALVKRIADRCEQDECGDNT